MQRNKSCEGVWVPLRQRRRRGGFASQAAEAPGWFCLSGRVTGRGGAGAALHGLASPLQPPGALAALLCSGP